MPSDAHQPAAIDGGRPPLDLGLLRLCGVELAVPVACVREVVPCPAVLGPGFGSHPALIGTIGVRGEVIPVVDVSVMLGLARAVGQGGTVAVLRREGALIGLRVDSVSGLQRVPASGVRELFDAAGEIRLIDRAFVRGQHLVGILDPAALFAIPGLPLVRAADQRDDAANLRRARAFVLVTAAGVQIAIDSQLVESTTPATGLRRCEVPAPGWTRYVSYLGRDVRVFDQLSTLGLAGETAEESDGPVILLRIASDKLVGWHVDAVRGVARIAAEQVAPLPATLAARGSLFSGIATDAAQGQNLMLEAEAVRGDRAIAAMAALCRPSSDGGRAAGSASRGGGAADTSFLVFDTGRRLIAAPLESIREVVRFGGLSSRVSDGNGLCGLGDYRGTPISIHAIDDTPASPELTPLLIVARDVGGKGARGVLAHRLATIVTGEALPVPGDRTGERFVPAVIDGTECSVRIHALG